MVRGDSPWKTWKELIEWAKAHPGEIKVGMPGSKYMQVQGIALGQIELRENVKFTYIPFKGASETLTALLGGNIDVYSTTVDASTVDYLKIGKVRLLAFSGKIKLPGYESIPSTDELYGISVCNFIGVVGPKGLPSYVAKTLIDAFQRGIKDPSFVDVMQKMYTPIVGMTGEEVGKYIAKTYKEQKEIIERLKKEEAKK
jgi:tripartite-type tricarboxylate transporter receptor subunit TctC